MIKSARQIALEVIYQVNEEGAYANIALDQALLACQLNDSRDKGLVTELTYGSIKNRGHLDYILDQFAKVKTTKMDKMVRNILRLALYQMLYLERIPTSAAVNEAVNLAKKNANRGSEKFVNGILRNIDRNREKIVYPQKKRQPVQYFSVMYSFPQWMVEQWYKNYGAAQTEALCRYFNEPQPLWIRANTLKISPKELERRLLERGYQVTASHVIEEGLCLSGEFNLHQLDLFQDGYFIVQDLSSMHVAHAAAPQKGQRVLDVCSAPGGKTTHLAQLMDNTGEIVACDIHAHRLQLIEENAARLGITNIITQLADGRHLGEVLTGTFDVVLVDAPCSGLGVLGRRADARWSKRRSDIKLLAQLQQEILQQAAALTKAGGTLVYSTCTMTAEENQQVIDSFLADHSEFILDTQLTQCWGETEYQAGMVQFLPFRDHMDGFFIAKLKRSGERK